MLRCFLAIWLALLIAVSITPVSFKLKLHMIGPAHNFAHYLAYAVTGIFFWVTAERWLGRAGGFVVGIAIAVGQEWAENKLYHAGFEWKDIGNDMAGLISGFALMLLITGLLADADINRPRERF